MIDFKVFYNKTDSVARLITSFHLLEKDGLIKLQLIENNGNMRKMPSTQMIEAEAAGKTIAFDMGDRWLLCQAENHDYLRRVDAYFARDYSAREDIVTPYVFLEDPKVMPFGFNYFSSYYGNPVTKPSAVIPSMKYSLRHLCGVSRCLSPQYIEQVPDFKRSDIRILFMARLWDPSTKRPDPSMSDEQYRYRQYMVEEWESINQTRIAVMRALKKYFGQSFFGGMFRDALSERLCPDLVLPTKMVRKKAYLDRMKKSDICIGTMGLHKSIGWKMGEYIAASRAIVAEPLEYVVPGNFEEGRNYLPFQSAESCCEQVAALLADPNRLYQMKQANHQYYLDYLEPRKQLCNALSAAGIPPLCQL